MTTLVSPSSRRLAGATVIAGVLGVALIWTGWLIAGANPDWSRFADPDYYLGGAIRFVGGLFLVSKLGIKAGLLLIGAVIAGTAWWRRRRAARSGESTEG